MPTENEAIIYAQLCASEDEVDRLREALAVVIAAWEAGGGWADLANADAAIQAAREVVAMNQERP